MGKHPHSRGAPQARSDLSAGSQTDANRISLNLYQSVKHPERAALSPQRSGRDSLFVVFFRSKNMGKTWVKNPPFLPRISSFFEY